MARKSLPLGPAALSVIERAPFGLLLAVLSSRGSANEPEYELPASAEAESEGARQAIIDALSQYDQEDLQPLEQRCRRINRLAEGKGVSSLDTIAEQRLNDEQHSEYSRQLDPLCRSIWTYDHFRNVFADAESFHLARQYRDYGKLYDAFEVELDKAMAINAASVDENALARRITEVLALKASCTVHALDLPPTDKHPQSIMLIVRHGGPLSSVLNHRDDGRREPLYYRPPNEATLIYTPSLRQIEVCADSPVVRQQVGASFAEVALEHDVSQKPLTWKRYNLSRFRSSLRLEPPQIDGYEIKFARVLEAEIRLGIWRRKLLLKVGIQDDIEEVADRYLKPHNIFRRADGFSRISIAVAYNRSGDDKERTLNISISGTKSCNLQSNKDPEERSLGYALLNAWEILSAFRQIDPNDLRAMFPQLLELHDRVENEVSGGYLHELGLDPDRLIQGGLLERRGRQDVVLIDDDIDGEGTIKPSSTPGMVRVIGPFGEDGGERPASDLEMYEINRQWLYETVLRLMKPLLNKRISQIIDPDLTLLGAMQIDGADVPVYFARRVGEPKIINKLDLLLRARNDSGFGIVLSASPEFPSCLGPNVVVSLLSHFSAEEDEPVLSHEAIEFSFRSGRSLAMGGSTPAVHRYAAQSGTLYVPGKSPLSLVGAKQINLFERLVNAHLAGSPDVKASTLTEGSGSRSPQQCFRNEMWKSILDTYITKGARNGFWRLAV